MKPRPETRQAGVALVTTVIVIAVLAVVAVAFMQSTGLDRLSARVGMNYYRAQLAAEAGAAVASALLVGQSANDDYIVVSNTNNQTFIGRGSNQPVGTFSYTPLLSVNSSLTQLLSTNTGAGNTIVTAGVPATNVAGGVRFTNTNPGGLVSTSPLITWVYMTNTNGTTNARFAFWVEDLEGRLDLGQVGLTNTAQTNSDGSLVARRGSGTNPAEIALWALFNPGANSDTANTSAAAVTANRSNLVTSATARLATVAVTPGMLQDLTFGLRHDTNEPNLVPFGFGYADQGQPKTLLPGADFNTVQSAITRNLPNFGSRGGGVPSSGYVNSIAANIVDFIDSDTTPTVGSGYRGVELLPFLNERATRYTLLGMPVNTNSGWKIEIATTEFFEFWNPHHRETPATSLSISLSNTQTLFYNGNQNFQINTNFTVPVPAMPPGSYFVTNTPTITNVFSVSLPPGSQPATNPVCRLIGNNPTVTYGVSAGGSLYDQGRGSHYSDVALPRSGGVMTYFSPGYPALGSKDPIGGIDDSTFFNSVGDPRASFYMTNASGPLPQFQPSWNNANSSFGGRNFQSGMSTDRLSKEVSMTNWGDSGHNGGRGTASSGTNAPATGLFLSGETNYAPARANPASAGGLTRITDLSHIFDPLAWSQTGQSPNPNWSVEPGAWANLTSSASSNSRFIGGNTLRLGRPEFTRFTNDGLRASHLLDIFAVTPTNSVSGRINLNTASTNALRALAAGVFHSNDPLIASASGAGTNFVVPAAAVNAFVAGVVARRSAAPFFSPSQLSLIATNTNAAEWPTNAVFGNRTLAGITAANDAATEEWLSRIYPLATVRSRNFLIHVVGQAVATNAPTVPLSSAVESFQVYLEPMRTNGLTTNCLVRTLGRWSL